MKVKIDEVPATGLRLRWEEPPASLDERLRGEPPGRDVSQGARAARRAAPPVPGARGPGDATAAIPAARTPIEADLTAARVARAVAVVGRLRATVGLECARCLRAVESALSLSAAFLFVPARPGARERGEAGGPLERLDLSGLPFELPGDELEVLDYAGQEIDLTQAVVDQVVLALPLKPLCEEACRGLCPTCGQDLNAASCRCAAERVDPRLAALKSLKLSR